MRPTRTDLGFTRWEWFLIHVLGAIHRVTLPMGGHPLYVGRIRKLIYHLDQDIACVIIDINYRPKFRAMDKLKKDMDDLQKELDAL